MKSLQRLTMMAIVAVAMPTPSVHGIYRGAVGMGRSVSLGSLTLTGVYPRIFTPNGDGANDKAVFHFDNPEELPVTGEIFDLSGGKVAALTPGSDPTASLLW